MRYRLTVAYDGTDFHGFAANPGVRTVAGVLSDALRFTVGEVTLVCAGRTDAGVHARGQVVTFDSERVVPPEAVAGAVNSRLSPEVVVREASWVADDFDARRSALGREYRYRILNAPVADPLLARTTWHVADPLDIARLRLACDPLIGEHDFSAFCRRPKGQGVDVSLVRKVVDAEWKCISPELLEFRIVASSFCHQMVRSIVGSMVEMGRGRRRPSEMTEILRVGDRNLAGPVAPPHGLVLWAVQYEGWSSG
ncbi:MAG: tRNA pseudouridine synthase A [Acidimicrobiales bacterium]|nr:MAG: tRNA pseudouridine synthase A [Acidimicrobiales bacterium]